MNKATKRHETATALSPMDIIVDRLGALRSQAEGPILAPSARYYGSLAAAEAAGLKSRGAFAAVSAGAALLATSALAPRAAAQNAVQNYVADNSNAAPAVLSAPAPKGVTKAVAAAAPVLAPVAALAAPAPTTPFTSVPRVSRPAAQPDPLLDGALPDSWQRRRGQLFGAFESRRHNAPVAPAPRRERDGLLPMLFFANPPQPSMYDASAPSPAGGGSLLGMGFGAVAGYLLPGALSRAMENPAGVLDQLGGALDSAGGMLDTVRRLPLVNQAIDFAMSNVGGASGGPSFAPGP